MKTITLFFMLIVSLISNAQRLTTPNSLQLVTNLTYKTLGFQFNKEFNFKKISFDYQIASESNLYSFSRGSLSLGAMVYETHENYNLKAYINGGISYSYIDDIKNISKEIEPLANSLGVERKIKHEISPEIGLYIVNERFTFSYHTDITRFVAYSRIGVGFSF